MNYKPILTINPDVAEALMYTINAAYTGYIDEYELIFTVSHLMNKGEELKNKEMW